MAVVAFVTFTFIFIGEINTLAPIVTMPYLMTYACIDYSYFALAQTFDIQHQREQRFHRPKVQQSSVSTDNDLDRLFPERTRHKTLNVSKPLRNTYSFLMYSFNWPVEQLEIIILT